MDSSLKRNSLPRAGVPGNEIPSILYRLARHLPARIVFELYSAFLCVWWLKRRMGLKWRSEKEYLSSDFL